MESRGMLIIRSNDTSILFRAALFDSSNAPITTAADLHILRVVPSTGALETYDFDDDQFESAAVTTPTTSMTHQQIENGAVDTGIQTYRHTTLTDFTVGEKYMARITHASLDRPIITEFQYGDLEGDEGLLLFLRERETAQGGAATSITLNAGASASNDFYNGHVIVIIAGTGVGQARVIRDYVGGTQVATVRTWVTNPDSTSEYVILPVDDESTIDGVWDEDIVAAHGTADTAGLLLRALGASISQRSNNPTLDALLGVPDTAGDTVVGTVWDQDIVGDHGGASTAGLLLRVLGGEISTRSFNNTLNDLLGAPDTAATDTVPGQVWEELSASHNNANTMGEIMNEVDASGTPTVGEIADGVWDEDIVAAHGTADTAGLLLRALGALISQRSNSPTLHGLLNVPDTAGADIGFPVWEEDIVGQHGSASQAGLLLRVLGASISTRVNNPTLDALLGVPDTASTNLPDAVWDEVIDGVAHAGADSAGQRLRALDILLEAGGSGDAAEILTQVRKLDLTALSGTPVVGSVAEKLNTIQATLDIADRQTLISVNIQGPDLRIECAIEQYGLVETAPWVQCMAQIFDESNAIIANIGIADFGAINSRGFFGFTLAPHGLVAGQTYQILVTISDGALDVLQTTKNFKVAAIS